MNKIINESAVINNSSLGNVKIFRNVRVVDSILEDGVSIGDDTTVERCILHQNSILNRRSYVNDSEIGAFTYAGINLTMNFTKIGKFCSIARNVDIGGFDHDYHKVTTMPMFRFQQMKNNGGSLINSPKHTDFCTIGNDVWIAAGAQVLHKVKIEDGAVIGGGAVVTHDVPPYAIVVGVPARIIGFRFDSHIINELLDIQWWNWPLNIIIENMPILIESDVDESMIEKLKSIAQNL